MKKSVKHFFFFSIIFTIIACGGSTSDQSVKPKVFKPKKRLSFQTSQETTAALYFQRTRGQRFYSGMENEPINSWVEVAVPRNDSAAKIVYEVMTNVVTQKAYKGYGDTLVGMTGLSFIQANDYCSLQLKAQLMSPYVFDRARETKAISRPNLPVVSELIAPYDEDIDDVFSHSDDKVLVNEESDSSFIVINWKDESYFSVSNTYKSNTMAFRCMRIKQ